MLQAIKVENQLKIKKNLKIFLVFVSHRQAVQQPYDLDTCNKHRLPASG